MLAFSANCIGNWPSALTPIKRPPRMLPRRRIRRSRARTQEPYSSGARRMIPRDPRNRIEKRPLRGVDLFMCLVDREPCDAIDLREILQLPPCGGHSKEKLFGEIVSGSNSPAAANASTIFPPLWRTAPSGSSFPETRNPVSSKNSRRAAAAASSPAAISPLGIDHAPSSLRDQ